MKKLIPLTLLSFGANAYECKEEAYRMELAEDYFWRLKVSRGVSEDEYSIVLSRYENIKHTDDVCVMNYNEAKQ